MTHSAWEFCPACNRILQACTHARTHTFAQTVGEAELPEIWMISGLAGIYSTSLSLLLLSLAPFSLSVFHLTLLNQHLRASLFLPLLRLPPPVYQITPVCFFFYSIFLLSFTSSLPHSPPSALVSVQDLFPFHLPSPCTFSPEQSNYTNPHHHPFSCFF